MKPSPRFLYLHGFASGPESRKATTIAAHYAARGVVVDRLDMRQPSMEHLRLSAMIHHVRGLIGGAHDRAVLIGSSLGGLTACRVAEQDARVCALVLLAPAFRIIERWPARLGEAAWEAWRATGWIETVDYARGGTSRVDHGFAEDAAIADAPGDGWPDVRVPTLIVHGRADEVVSIDLSREWAAGKRHVRLVEVEDGHELGASVTRIVGALDEFLSGFLNPIP